MCVDGRAEVNTLNVRLGVSCTPQRSSRAATNLSRDSAYRSRVFVKHHHVATLRLMQGGSSPLDAAPVCVFFNGADRHMWCSTC